MQGPPLFSQQLKALGYAANVDTSWVEFDYVVPGGKYEGAEIRMAIQVPPAFPVTPPGGIEFTPRFPDRPVKPGGQHPERSHPSRRFKENGEYWSRPYPDWNQEAGKTATTYMAWVTHLWMTT